MGLPFYTMRGEKQKLNPKIKKIGEERTKGESVYIPELRIWVFTKKNETPEQTRERYLKKSSYKNEVVNKNTKKSK